MILNTSPSSSQVKHNRSPLLPHGATAPKNHVNYLSVMPSDVIILHRTSAPFCNVIFWSSSYDTLFDRQQQPAKKAYFALRMIRVMGEHHPNTAAPPYLGPSLTT